MKEYGKGFMHGAGAGAVSGGLVGSAAMARALKKKHEKKATFEATLSVVTDAVPAAGDAFRVGFVDGMKTAFVGVDDIAGGLLGHDRGKKQKERGEKYNFGGKQLAAVLLIPGGAGYQVGRAIAHGSDDGKRSKKTASTAGELAGLGVLAVPAVMDIAHRPKKETQGEAKMRKIRAGAEITGLGILAGSAIRSATKAAASIHGDRGDTRSNEELLRSSPLGERILADYNARNEHLQAAVDSWRRMRTAGTSRADKITV